MKAREGRLSRFAPRAQTRRMGAKRDHLRLQTVQRKSKFTEISFAMANPVGVSQGDEGTASHVKQVQGNRSDLRRARRGWAIWKGFV